MKYKQGQLSSQFEIDYIDVARRQKCFKEEIDSIFKEKNFAELLKKNEILEKLIAEKCEEIKEKEAEFFTQKRLFEEKVKELLKRVSDQDVQFHMLGKETINESRNNQR